MRVAGYVRLSRDEDKESYSSILSQKSIIEEHALQHNWKVEKYYEDDNCSGYSFDRPAFNEMMREMENQQIDIVIAKDLSRIGRHNAYTLLFLDKIKKMNIRLILPKEGRGYDTLQDENDLLGITTWYNEMYVKDISRKIKGSIKAKQKEGHLIIKEVFGYRRSLTDKHKLEVDLEAADIIKKIFDLYLSGMGYRRIAEELNSRGCPTPSKYNMYKSGNISGKGKTADLWNSVHVQRILKNDIYTGTLRLGKTEKRTIKGKSEKLPMDQQYIFQNNHSAIVSKEQFEEVQKIAERRKKDFSKGAASLHNVFSGMMYCQSCSSYMIAYNKAGKSKSYICGSYHKYGRQSCMRHTIQEDILQKAIHQFLEIMVITYSEEIKKMKVDSDKKYNSSDQQLLKTYIHEQQQCKTKFKQLIMQKVTAIEKESNSEYQSMIYNCYDELERELKQRLLYLEARLKELEQGLEAVNLFKKPEPYDLLIEILNQPQLQKKHIEKLIDKILIDQDGSPTIYVKANIEVLCSHSREGANLVPDQSICIWQDSKS
jgi:DNA invertase Pin-like site-specific DNA recombinase